MRTSSIGQIFGDFGAPRQINPAHAGAYTRPVRTYISEHGGVDGQTGKWDRDKSNHHQYRRNE